MTEGSIAKQIVLFALPLMLGNIFQMLYNTVDSVIVGNFVSKQALAAIGSTFVGVRQLYLYLVTHFVSNTPYLVGFGYPVGWMTCCAVELCYYFIRWRGRKEAPVLY